ncbi:MAG: hypothetical protein ABFS12_12610 [Bacteroidota bacterium]
MHWLEIIELRTVDKNLEILKEEFKNLIKEVEKATKREGIKTYSNEMIDTDFCVHLFHDSEKVDKGGSPLALHIVSALKEYGLVHHKIWIEFK